MLENTPWYVLGLGSAVLFAISVILSKEILGHEHALEYSTIRSVFNVAITLLLIPFVNWKLLINNPAIVIILLFSSIATSAAILYRAKAQRHLEISIVSPMENISPLFLLILSFIFLKEKITLTQLGGIILLLISAYILQSSKHESILTPLKKFLKSEYIHYILFAMIVFSITQVVDKYLFNTYDINPATYLFLLWTFISINFLFLDFYKYGLKDLKKDLTKDFWKITLASVFGMGSLLLHFTALKHAPISLLIPIRRSNALFVVLIGGKMMHEKNLLKKFIATTLMIISIILIILK